METTASEMMRNYVNSQKFRSTAEIMEAMKDLFRNALQHVMEGKLEEKLGNEKSERMSETEENGQSKNYRNGYSKKSVKTQLGKVEVKIPRDRNGEYEPKIIAKYDRNADGMEEKILGSYACGISQRALLNKLRACVM